MQTFALVITHNNNKVYIIFMQKKYNVTKRNVTLHQKTITIQDKRNDNSN